MDFGSASALVILILIAVLFSNRWVGVAIFFLVVCVVYNPVKTADSFKLFWYTLTNY